MIKYSKHALDNGLTVIIHEDQTTPIAVVNTLYHVGSKNEEETKTGFAHLFEHLMFGGSKNVALFDEPLQKVGGDNNAFTTPDITNYYITLPSQNLETAFWLESDRMLALSFDPNVLEVQRKVVIEEFKQRYLNQPYGDVWLKLRPLAYTQHSYKWPTIGKEISHIENATMDDVRKFFYNYYAPNNATLVVAGNVREREVLNLVEKWYGDIPAKPHRASPIKSEPTQTAYRFQEVRADVPVDALYMAFHIPGKKNLAYYTSDLLSDLLGRGASSRLYESLVKNRPVFSSLSAHNTGAHDPGLLVISGRTNQNVSISDAEKYVWEVLEKFVSEDIADFEVDKVKNQAESVITYNETEVLNRAMNLAIATSLGDTDLVNEEVRIIQSITKENLREEAQKTLRKENCSVMHYLSESKA